MAVSIAIICTDMVLFDVDNIAEAERASCESAAIRGTNCRHRTAASTWGFAKSRGRCDEPGPDQRAADRYPDRPGTRMIPTSFTEAGCYECLGPGLLPVHALPVAAVGWTRKRMERPLTPVVLSDDQDVMVRRARGYLACVEGAISGHQGHNRTMRAAGILIQKFGLTLDQAWPLFLEWNEQCEPPWSEKELLHKLQDAHRLRFERRDQR